MWRNLRRGCGSNHGDSDNSGDGWDCTEDRVVAASPTPSPAHPPHPNFLRRRRGASVSISAPQSSLLRGITEMGGAETLQNS